MIEKRERESEKRRKKERKKKEKRCSAVRSYLHDNAVVISSAQVGRFATPAHDVRIGVSYFCAELGDFRLEVTALGLLCVFCVWKHSLYAEKVSRLLGKMKSMTRSSQQQQQQQQHCAI